MLFLDLRHKFANNKTLIENFSSLSILQFSNYIFLLITLPYLVRVLGPANYGLVNFATAFAMYFQIFTDYGFNLTATQEISVNRGNPQKINRIFSVVLVIKIILFFISAVIFAALVFAIPKFSTDSLVYLFSFLIVLGTVLFPVWFFQGMERMKYITIISLSVKSLWAVSIFVLIKSGNDVLLLILLNGISYILIGVISLIVIIIEFKIKFVIPKISEIKKQLIDGWNVFSSTASISLYTISNVFVLGLFAGNTVVGYFSAADKIRIAVQGLFQNASQSVFPHLSRLFVESKTAAVKFVKKYLKYGVTLAGITTIIIIIFSKVIVIVILGDKFLPSINVLRILMFLPVIILLSNIYGIQIMLNLGYKKEFSKIVFFAGILNLILLFILVPLFLEMGAAISVVVTECFVTIEMFYFVRKKKILEPDYSSF